MYSPMRIGGLASGMDIDQIVSDMMKAERTRVDTLYQRKQTLQWQQEYYREINARLLSFQTSAFNMKLKSAVSKSTAIVSNESIVTAIAGSAARDGVYTLKVNKLAEQALKESGTLSKPIEGSSLAVPITIDSSNNEMNITLDGVQKTITLTERNYDGISFTLNDLVDDIQGKVDQAFGADTGGESLITVGLNGDRLTFEPGGDYKPQITLGSGTNDALGVLGFNDGDSFKISTTDALKTIGDKFVNDPFASGDIIEFRINGQTFSYDFSPGGADENKTLGDIISDINKNTDTGVEAYYDSITDKMVIKSKEYGSGAQVLVENISGSLFGAAGALQIDGSVDYGTGSEIELNGVTITNSSNKFTVDGVSYTLNKVSAETVEISVQKDIQASYDAIKSFVDDYNGLIDLINGKLTEEKFRGYPPLTDEQKAALSERDIELWEEKAKSGLLRSDSMLRSIVSNMRSIMYSQVEGLDSGTNMLAAIGITTSNYKEMGKLHINEDKLKEALTYNMEGVVALFSQTGTQVGEDGIAVRLYDAAKNAINSVTEKAGSAASLTSYDNSFMGNRIRDVDDKIFRMEDHLLQLEDRYWRQFTAMEKALGEMNTQSMWLSQQLMGMGGY